MVPDFFLDEINLMANYSQIERERERERERENNEAWIYLAFKSDGLHVNRNK